MDDAANSPDEDVRDEAKRRGGRGEEPATVSMNKPDLAGYALTEYCAELLRTEKDDARRTVILSWRGKGYTEMGEYALAYSDLRKSYIRERLLAAFALGRFGEAFSEVWQVNSGKPKQEKAENEKLYSYLSYMTGNLYDPTATDNGSRGDFESDVMMLLVSRQNSFAYCAGPKNVTKGPAGLNKSHQASIAYSAAFQTALIQHLQGELPESKLLVTMHSKKELLIGNWALAELALIHGKTAKAQSHLTICLATEAYTDPIFIMARLRKQALTERS